MARGLLEVTRRTNPIGLNKASRVPVLEVCPEGVMEFRAAGRLQALSHRLT